MNKYDAIIIGGGLGGLTTGAKLSKEGKKVLLIEQHYVPGGCATTFKRKDFTMEVGLHEMDGLDKSDPKTEIFHDLKVFDNIKFLKAPEFYRFKNERIDIVVPDSTGKAIKVLTKKFPKEEKGIGKFFKVIHELQWEINLQPLAKWKKHLLLPLYPAIFPYLAVSSSKLTNFTSHLNPLFYVLHPNLVFWKHKSIGGFVDSIISDEDLKLVLLANIQYYHDNPYTMSLVYFSAAQASYYNGGGHYIKGGSQKLSDYLAKSITDNGGDVLLGNKVSKIMIENDFAVGVEYKKTTDSDGEAEKVFANTIIANSAIPNVVNLLPKESQSLLKEKIGKLEKACSLISIYIGFKKEIKQLGNKHYSTFVFDENVKSPKDMLKNHKGDFRKRNFVFVDYSQIDSGLTPKGKSFGVVCTVDYLEDWEKLSTEEYKKKRRGCSNIFQEIGKRNSRDYCRN